MNLQDRILRAGFQLMAGFSIFATILSSQSAMATLSADTCKTSISNAISGYFQRAVSSNDLSYWVPQCSSSADLQTFLNRLYVELRDSDERGIQLVQSGYQSSFGRLATQLEVDFYLRAIHSGIDNNIVNQHIGAIGRAYPMASAFSNDQIWDAAAVADKSPLSLYSSSHFNSSTNDRGTFLAAWMPQFHHAAGVLINARMGINGKPLGFPKLYDLYITSADNTQWIYAGRHANQPQEDGFTVILLPDALNGVQTRGVLMLPIILGTDNENQYYFQIADLMLIGNDR